MAKNKRIRRYAPKLKYPPPSLESRELIGLFAGTVNGEGTIGCLKTDKFSYPMIRIAMDSKSSLEKLEPLTNVPTTRYFDKERGKYQYRQVLRGSRACTLVKASKHLLSDEKLKQFEDVGKECPCV